jgi:hypothetical protein
MYTRSARIDAMIETYREGSADKKCGKCGKGKAKCSKCSHEKEESMKEDGLTVDEYLAACELGINNQSRTYIRARLDAAGLKMKGKGIKCGNGYISQGETCGGAKGKKAPDDENSKLLGKGERNLYNARYSVKSGAKVGAQRGAMSYAALGAIMGAASGGGIKNVLATAAKGAVVGGAVGAATGAGVRAGSKGVRALRNRKARNQSN